MQIEKLQFHKIIVFSLKNYKTVNFDFEFKVPLVYNKCAISIKSVIIFEVKEKYQKINLKLKLGFQKLLKGR